MNFTDLWLFAKVFSAKFRGVASFGVAQASYPQKFSLRNRIFQQFARFLPQSFPLYGMHSALFVRDAIFLQGDAG